MSTVWLEDLVMRWFVYVERIYEYRMARRVGHEMVCICGMNR